mmetsp:Transcript_16378/g.36159  ORF Transcript_16378/g.36159 Transcript_16378/m.36159 type:complete len:786 (+) Transcript_16378:66-2423(+)
MAGVAMPARTRSREVAPAQPSLGVGKSFSWAAGAGPTVPVVSKGGGAPEPLSDFNPYLAAYTKKNQYASVNIRLTAIQQQQQLLSEPIPKIASDLASSRPSETQDPQTVPDADPRVRVMQKKDLIPAGFMLFLGLAVVIVMCVWDPHRAREDAHSATMLKYQARITSPLYPLSEATPLSLELKDAPRNLLDIKVVLPRIVNTCGSAYEAADHRRLQTGHRRGRISTGPPAVAFVPPVRRRLSSAEGGDSGWCANLGANKDLAGTEGPAHAEPNGTVIKWEIFCGTGTAPVATKSYTLKEDQETEDLATVSDLDTDATCPLFIKLTTNTARPLGVLVEVVHYNAFGAQRVILAAALFVVTFALIISEVIHRCYVTFFGSLAGLFLLSIIHEAPHMPEVVAMIDFGTLMLLFSMMIVVHNLAATGFFEWFAVRIAMIAGGDFKKIFFLLSTLTGVLSAFLDNVTCVMLVGPVTINLCKQLGVNPVPLYLTETLCATIGGAATLIGDPPNVVIGNKLQIGFADFIVYNAPVVVVLLPVAVTFMWMRMREQLKTTQQIDLVKLAEENPILDQREFLFVAIILGGIMFALFLSPVHGQEAAWFTMFGAMCSCIVHSHHNFRLFLEAVEWDTLMFFATLFVFVESLGEMGLIRALGDALTDLFTSVPIEARMEVACFVMLWVAGLGSAFLESLPFTTTVAYILISLRNEDSLGIPVMPLAWALSLGACVGGIGSIMGSSANLVAMSISERYSPKDKIEGKHFLQYGLPLLIVLLIIGSVYQYVLFSVIKPY